MIEKGYRHERSIQFAGTAWRFGRVVLAGEKGEASNSGKNGRIYDVRLCPSRLRRLDRDRV